MNVLELSNSETGAFRVRLLRKGERYGLHHQLIWDEDRAAIEFYGPAADNERPAEAPFLGRWRAAQYRRPRTDWPNAAWAGYCGVSPENSHEIAQWLDRELERPWTPPPPPERPASQARVNRPIELHDAGNRRVTLYVGGLFGYQRTEAEWVRVERRPDGTYADAVFVEYQPRRARSARLMRLTSSPDLVILLGWDHPELQQTTESTQTTMKIGPHTMNVTTTQTKYASADPRYPQEFESALDTYLSSLPLTQLLLDLRGETITRTPRMWRTSTELTTPIFHPSGVRGREPDDARAAVFISYHHGRDAVAREQFEREHGTIIRSSSIYPGEVSRGPEVRREIRRRIVGCDFVVVLVGKETYTRRWVDWEIRAALTRGPDGAPRPVLGVLLPEAAALHAILPADKLIRAGETADALRRRSDQLGEEMLAAVGTTLPARLLDNLLTGYARLIAWPASSDVLRDALVLATAQKQPLNGRQLLRRNQPSNSNAVPACEQAPNESNGEEVATPQVTATPIAGDTTPMIRMTANDPVPPGDDPAWLVRALQRHGPRAVLAGLETGDHRHRRLAAILRPHAHLLEPLDNEVSIAATLAARLAEEDLRTALAMTLQTTHLTPVAPVPDRHSAGLLRTFPGTDGGIVAMTADPAGRWLATLTWTGVICVWDVAAGAIRHVLPAPDDATANRGRMLITDPGGAWLAAAGPEGLIEVWDPIVGVRLHALASVFGGIGAMTVDPQGAWMAAADDIGIIQWWSMPSGEPLHRTSHGSGYVRTMVVDPEGRWLAAGDSNAVHVWDAGTAKRHHKLAAPGSVSALTVSPRGDWLACACGVATVRVWPMPGGSPARDFTNRARVTNKKVRCLATDPGGRWLAAGGHEGAIRIWSPNSGTRRLVLDGHKGGWDDAVEALAVSPDGHWLASGGTDQTVRVWDIAAGVERACFTGHSDEITQLVAGPNGRWLAAADSGGTVRLWDPAAPQSRSVDPPSKGVTTLAADPAGSWHAYAGGADGEITISTARGDMTLTASSHAPHVHGAVTALLADPKASWLASAGRDGTLRIWDPRDGSERYKLIGRTHQDRKEIATQLLASPDGRWLAGRGNGPTVWIWSPITGTRLNTLWAAGGRLWDVTVDPTGTWLATAADDGAIRLWHPNASRPHRILKGHQNSVRSLAVHPTGAYLVSAGEDATVRIWNLADDTATVRTLPTPAIRLVMSSHGDWFASVGADNAVYTWDSDGSHVVLGHAGPIAEIAAHPAGRFLATVAADGTLRIWEPASGTAIASIRVDGPLTQVRWVSDRLIVAGAQGVYQFRLSAADNGVPSHGRNGDPADN